MISPTVHVTHSITSSRSDGNCGRIAWSENQQVEDQRLQMVLKCHHCQHDPSFGQNHRSCHWFGSTGKPDASSLLCRFNMPAYLLGESWIISLHRRNAQAHRWTEWCSCASLERQVWNQRFAYCRTWIGRHGSLHGKIQQDSSFLSSHSLTLSF